MTWLFIDDQEDAATALADLLRSAPHPLNVEVISPAAKAQLLSGDLRPDGLLVDVDLSGAPGLDTGPGIAQTVRLKQRNRDIEDFPMIRFAGREPIRRYIGGDPTSDDLFEMLVAKEEVDRDPVPVQRALTAVLDVYRALREHSSPLDIARLVGVEEGDQLEEWVDGKFVQRLTSASAVADHVAAGLFTRSFLFATGILIDEVLLSIRLGVDLGASSGWSSLRSELETARYKGAGAATLERWWAVGLSDWWFAHVDPVRSLHMLTIDERMDALSAVGFTGLTGLQMPVGSPGLKPWRVCTLAVERDSSLAIPVDPSEAPRLTPDRDMSPWLDPLHASLQLALQVAHEDLRIDRDDLSRLKIKYAGGRL